MACDGVAGVEPGLFENVLDAGIDFAEAAESRSQ